MVGHRFYQPLYYANVLNRTLPSARRYASELSTLRLNKFEAKRMMDVFEDWAYLLWNTNDSETDIRKRLLHGILRRRNFKFTKPKENESNHPMLSFYNLLIAFYGGEDVYHKLVESVVIDRLHQCFDFKW